MFNHWCLAMQGREWLSLAKGQAFHVGRSEACSALSKGTMPESKKTFPSASREHTLVTGLTFPCLFGRPGTGVEDLESTPGTIL